MLMVFSLSFFAFALVVATSVLFDIYDKKQQEHKEKEDFEQTVRDLMIEYNLDRETVERRVRLGLPIPKPEDKHDSQPKKMGF